MKRREKLPEWEERDLQMMKEFVSCTCGECWKKPYVIYEDGSATRVKFVIAKGGEA